MEKLKTRTSQILVGMNVLAWVAFIGFLIEAGALLVSYLVSCVNPEAAKDLYRSINLYDLSQYNFWYYTLYVTVIVVMLLMKSFTGYLVTRVLSKISLQTPFTMEVAVKLERISYVLFGFWLVGMIKNALTALLLNFTGVLHGNWFNGEVIVMTGLVYIFSQVFKRGVEIQSENDLTV